MNAAAERWTTSLTARLGEGRGVVRAGYLADLGSEEREQSAQSRARLDEGSVIVHARSRTRSETPVEDET